MGISLVIALHALTIAAVISFTILRYNAQNIAAARQKRLDEIDMTQLHEAGTVERRKLLKAEAAARLAERDLLVAKHQLRLSPPEDGGDSA